MLEWRLQGLPPLADDDASRTGRTSTTRRSTTRTSSTTPRPSRRRRPEEPRRGRSRAAARPTRSSASRCDEQRAARRRRGRRGVRQRLGRDHLQGQARRAGHHLLLVLRGGAASTPSWCRSTSARSCPYTDNFFAALNSAVFTDGSFCYVPKGVRCPMELSTYFRINAANTGQFERTLIIADEGAYVSYLEGCTAPMRDENQLHAAVVELVRARRRARSSTRPCRTGTRATRTAAAASTTSSPSAATAAGAQLEDLLDAGRDRLGDHLEVPELHPAGRRLGRRVLLGGADQPTTSRPTPAPR